MCHTTPNAVFLDIETTGLSKHHDQIVCVGLLSLEDEQLTQWVQSDHLNEQALLQSVIETLATFTTLYTCGQGSFDLDFLASRLEAHGLYFDFKQRLTCISLYKLPFFKLLRESSYTKRQDLEHQVGYKREILITGRELAKLAQLHLTTPTALYEEVLLKHNREELIGCQYFYELYKQISTLTQAHSTATLTEDHLSFTYPLNSTRLSECTLKLKDVLLEICPHANEFILTVPTQRLVLKRYLYPAKDYVYIPTEGQLIHKSIAQFFPSSMKEKVSQANCFLSQEMDFIPSWTKSKKISSQWVDAEKNCYIPFQELKDYTFIETKLIKYLTQG